MQCVILAAGRGKRMKGLTKNTPKPMLKVGKCSILEHKIKMLPKSIKEIVFIVGYCAENIMDNFGREFDGRKITYVFQKKLNGTGGAIHLARSVLEDKFLVMMGDDLYCKKDIVKILKNKLAVLAKEVENPSDFGILETNRRGYLEEIIEKPKRPKSNLANAAVYVLSKDFFDYELVSIGNGEYGLPQTLAKMTDKHKIKVEKASFWCPISCQEDLEAAEKVIHKLK